jgi:hypothetical protein
VAPLTIENCPHTLARLSELVAVHAHGDERNAEVVGHIWREFVDERESQPPSERSSRGKIGPVVLAAVVGRRARVTGRGKIRFTGATGFAIYRRLLMLLCRY